MSEYYLAIDIGASSGRHILGHVDDEGKMILEEVYRFENGMVESDGHLVWNHERTLEEIINGLKKCKEIGKIPKTMAIDTWGVDYGLIGSNEEKIGETYAYRDHRTDGMDEEVYALVSEDELYERCGIQKAIYNTIYQLMATNRQEPENMDVAKAMLMTPDYLNYLLTGVKAQEYTIATTSGLIDPLSRDWDYDLIYRLGFNEEIFIPVSMPGTPVGYFKKTIEEKVGFNCKVVMCGSHDTASAVLSVPADSDDYVYISSGTWSLMGVVRHMAHTGEEGKKANFTNEGGVGGTIRYLTNIMGLWMIQSVRHELEDKYSFAELCELAEKVEIDSVVDVNDECFLSPDSMIKAVKLYCVQTNQKVPETPGELAKVIYVSLAKCYAKTIETIESLTKKKYTKIHVVGGGSNADYLNKLTAKETGRTVIAGPGEATAIGNITLQMITDNVFSSDKDAKKCIRESFDTKVFEV